MLPRLPPLLLAVIGGVSIYGIKAVLDRIEPKALGPPGSSEHAERMFRIKQHARRAGYAAAGSSVLYAVYWLYHSRTHRATPAAQNMNRPGFYEDQYSDREQLQARDLQKQKELQVLREQQARERLESEQRSMLSNENS